MAARRALCKTRGLDVRGCGGFSGVLSPSRRRLDGEDGVAAGRGVWWRVDRGGPARKSGGLRPEQVRVLRDSVRNAI